MTVLVIDTAASRFHTDKKTGEEPRCVRLAWLRSDETEPVCRLIKPVPGMTLDKAALPYHGLMLGDLERDGVDAAEVIRELEAAALGVTAIASYNESFHWRTLHRLMNAPDGLPKPENAVDVMALATPILAIPLMRPGSGFKSASLREACRYFDIPEPATIDTASPKVMATSTVEAILKVYEACAAATKGSGV